MIYTHMYISPKFVRTLAEVQGHVLASTTTVTHFFLIVQNEQLYCDYLFIEIKKNFKYSNQKSYNKLMSLYSYIEQKVHAF